MARAVAWLRNDLRLHDNAGWPFESLLRAYRPQMSGPKVGEAIEVQWPSLQR